MYILPSKAGQPMAAVRQGKSFCMAISPYFLRTSPKKTSPAAARRRNTVICVHTKEAGGGWGSSRKGRFGGDCLSERGGPSKVFPLRHLSPAGRAVAGEGLAGGGLEGTASPKEAAPPRSSSLSDNPAGDYGVAVVQDNRLTFGDGALGGIEHHAQGIGVGL